MKLSNYASLLTDPTTRKCRLFPAAALICLFFLVGSGLVTFDYKEKSSAWEMTGENRGSNLCESQCKPLGAEPLPKGIVRRTSNLEMRSLRGSPQSPKRKVRASQLRSLLAIAVGIKQKEFVNEIVKKFPSSDFVVMLFHYDAMVDEWKDLEWSDRAIHVSAINQTKWWFAKRFLHPDIVHQYAYIFLWDEDLGVEHFNPGRYLSIIKREGLEISQPALDAAKSQVHHRITARGRKGDVHRRIYKHSGSGRCYENSTAPQCTGWVEMMAPVFSRAAWRCVWHLIQNDLIHAWGLDMKLGYCAQGERSKNVGVVDKEYIVHKGIPTLGAVDKNKTTADTPDHAPQSKTDNLATLVPPGSPASNDRSAVRNRSFEELEIFRQRWKRAIAEDECWINPYPEPTETVNH